jgi:hypothetical protein
MSRIAGDPLRGGTLRGVGGGKVEAEGAGFACGVYEHAGAVASGLEATGSAGDCETEARVGHLAGRFGITGRGDRTGSYRKGSRR